MAHKATALHDDAHSPSQDIEGHFLIERSDKKSACCEQAQMLGNAWDGDVLFLFAFALPLVGGLVTAQASRLS